jgi:hypothetical protein
MSRSLKRDICNLKAPGTLISTIKETQRDLYLSESLRYACEFWVYHLQAGINQFSVDRELQNLVYAFLEKHLLHWLEALSITGKLSLGADMVKTLQSIIAVSSFIKLLPLTNII